MQKQMFNYNAIKYYSHRYTNFPIGTTKEQEVIAAASCCLEGLRLRVTDVSGEVAEAHAVWNETNSKLSSTTIAAILTIVILIIVTGTIGLTYYAKKNDKCCFVSQSSSNNDTSQKRPLKPIPEEVFFYKDKPSN